MGNFAIFSKNAIFLEKFQEIEQTQKEKEKTALSKDLEEFKREEERAALELWQVFRINVEKIVKFCRKIKNIKEKSSNKKRKK